MSTTCDRCWLSTCGTTTLAGHIGPSASSPLPKPIPSGPSRLTSPITGSARGGYSGDSYTSTTSPPDCSPGAPNRISEPHTPDQDCQASPPLDLPVQRRKVLNGVIDEYHQAALADRMNPRSD